MRVIRSVAEMATWRHHLNRHAITVGLVPTMGALHAGHMALIRAARLACDAVVVSLFVNPSQFDDPKDLARYPRTFAADKEICRRAGVDVLFVPSIKDMYPSSFQTTVSLSKLTRRWEGQHRPGHFTGVATVVTKLFSLIRPHRAFFGQKDYQQALVVRRLAEDLALPIAVEVRPTVREPDGLALSSRNARLTAAQRRQGAVLPRALAAGDACIRQGERMAERVAKAMRNCVTREPGVTTDYLAVCDPDTLEPVRRIKGSVVLLGAIRVGSVRLIDNLIVSRMPTRSTTARRASGRSDAAVRARRRGRARNASRPLSAAKT
jgi:pantoate--beta-alanine ligase